MRKKNEKKTSVLVFLPFLLGLNQYLCLPKAGELDNSYRLTVLYLKQKGFFIMQILTSNLVSVHIPDIPTHT